MNYPAPDPVARQVANTCRELIAQPGLPFAQHLPEQQVHDALHDQHHTFRPRIYTPAVTLWTFLSQCLDKDHSCEHAVDRLLAYRAAEGLPDCSADTGAYCKARARRPESLFRVLVQKTGRGQMDQAERQWLWKGRQVKLVDGTGLSMPDTPENQKEYPQLDTIRPRVGFPLMRLDVRQRGFRTKRYVLITTLTDAATYSARDLAELYRRRWQAELNLRALETTLQMDILRGKTPDIVRKEVWAHLLAYNLIRGLMTQAARQVKVRPDEVSFTGALHAVNAFLPKLPGARTEAEAVRLWEKLLALIGRRQVGDRPDRVEPRQVKRRPKKYPKLTMPRAKARRQLLKDATRKGPKT